MKTSRSNLVRMLGSQALLLTYWITQCRFLGTADPRGGRSYQRHRQKEVRAL